MPEKKLLHVYVRMMRLYPASYSREFKDEILLTAKDMLAEVERPLQRYSLWSYLIIDLLMSIGKQQLFYIGGNMMHTTPNYIKKTGMTSAGLLLPFFAAVVANGLDNLFFGRQLYGSWLWNASVLRLWVLMLPMLALLLALGAYLVYAFHGAVDGKQGLLKRAVGLRSTWPVAISGAIAFGIVFIVFFHDSIHCWVQMPNHLISHMHQTWQCTDQGRVSFSKFFHHTF